MMTDSLPAGFDFVNFAHCAYFILLMQTEEKYQHYVNTLTERIQTCDDILRQVNYPSSSVMQQNLLVTIFLSPSNLVSHLGFLISCRSMTPSICSMSSNCSIRQLLQRLKRYMMLVIDWCCFNTCYLILFSYFVEGWLE